jgi:hypothetical protein
VEVFKQWMAQFKMEAMSVGMHIALILAPCLPIYVGAINYDTTKKMVDPTTDPTSFTWLLRCTVVVIAVYVGIGVFYMTCYYMRGKGQLPGSGSDNGESVSDEAVEAEEEAMVGEAAAKVIKVVPRPGAGMLQEGTDDGGCVLKLATTLYYLAVVIVGTLSACVTACFLYWTLLGTVINPERIVPVAAGVASFTAHFVRFKLLLSGIRAKILNCIGKWVEKAKKMAEKMQKLKKETDKYKKKLDKLAEVAAGGGDLEDAIYQMLAEITVDKYVCPEWVPTNGKEKGPLVGLTPFVKKVKLGWPPECADEREYAVLKVKKKIRQKIKGEEGALEAKKNEIKDKAMEAVFGKLEGKLNDTCGKIGKVIGEFKGHLLKVVRKWGLGKSFEDEVGKLYDDLTVETREDLKNGKLPPRLPKNLVAELQEQIVTAVRKKKKHIEKVIEKVKGAVEAGQHLTATASKFLMEQGLQDADILVLVLMSSLMLVLLLAFIMVGVEVFSEPGMTASTVNTVLNLIAGKSVNQNASSPFAPEKVERWTHNLSRLCEKVVEKAEADFVDADAGLLGMGGGDAAANAAIAAEAANEDEGPAVVANPLVNPAVEAQKVAV